MVVSPFSDLELEQQFEQARALLTDGGYVGLAVHTAARICSAGHGGQILLSSDAVQAVEGSAPCDVSFRSLGAHRLQGLPEPQPLFQLEAPDLPGNFPAPRTTKRRQRAT